MLKSALGFLRWTPETFWKSSFFEFTAAMEGYLASKGVRMNNQNMTRADYLDLKALDKPRKAAMSGAGA